jgi:hypothetical protein
MEISTISCENVWQETVVIHFPLHLHGISYGLLYTTNDRLDLNNSELAGVSRINHDFMSRLMFAGEHDVPWFSHFS